MPVPGSSPSSRLVVAKVGATAVAPKTNVVDAIALRRRRFEVTVQLYDKVSAGIAEARENVRLR